MASRLLAVLLTSILLAGCSTYYTQSFRVGDCERSRPANDDVFLANFAGANFGVWVYSQIGEASDPAKADTFGVIIGAHATADSTVVLPELAVEAASISGTTTGFTADLVPTFPQRKPRDWWAYYHGIVIPVGEQQVRLRLRLVATDSAGQTTRKDVDVMLHRCLLKEKGPPPIFLD